MYRKENHKRTNGGNRRRVHGQMLEAYLLCLLKEKPSYGYELLENLQQFEMNTDRIDISMIYRNLRKMEAHYLIVSEWSESDQGPQKRVYTITHDGEMALKHWIEIIKQRQIQLQAVITKFEQLTS